MITIKELALGAISVSESGGAKLARILHHIGKGAFVVLSGYRGNLSYEENQKRNAALISRFRKYGLGGIQLVGHFIEDHDGKQVPVQERSFFIPLKGGKIDGRDMDEQDLLELAIEVAKEFDQEAILYGDQKGTYALDIASNESFHIGNAISQENLGDYYSQVKNRYWKFAFRESAEYRPFVIDGEVLPRNHAEGIALENLGLFV